MHDDNRWFARPGIDHGPLGRQQGLRIRATPGAAAATLARRLDVLSPAQPTQTREPRPRIT